MREWLLLLLLVLDDSGQLTQILMRLQQQLQRLARIKARKRNPSHAQLLDQPELPD